MTSYDNAPTDPHHGGKVWEPDPKPHPDPENSISCAIHDLRLFYKRNFAAAYELEDGRNLDALAYALDDAMQKLEAVLGQLEMDADGVATEQVDERKYEDAL